MNKAQTGVETAGVKHSMNPFDELSIEESVRIREKKRSPGGVEDICAISAGPAKAVDVLRGEGRDVLPWSPARAFRGDAHAGEVETSIMLALAPETVDMDRAAAGNTDPLAELMPTLVVAGVRGVSDNGVLGDPTTATMQRGAELLADAVRALVAFVDRWPARWPQA